MKLALRIISGLLLVFVLLAGSGITQQAYNLIEGNGTAVARGSTLNFPNTASVTWSCSTSGGVTSCSAVYAPAVATVATLPASPVTNQVVPISDGAAASDCTTGSGTVAHSCQWNGSAWVAYYTQSWVMFVAANQAVGASTTLYGSVASAAFGTAGFAALLPRQAAIGSACHLSGLYVSLLSAQGASTMTLTLYKNGAAQSPTVTVAPSATQGTVISDTTDSADFLPADLLAVQAANGSGAASAFVNVSLVCQL